MTIRSLQANEDSELAVPAWVDVSRLVPGVVRVTELSLTASRPAAEVPRPRRWPVEQPQPQPPQPDEPEGVHRPVPPLPRWGSLIAAAQTTRVAAPVQAPVATYDIWSHSGDAPPVFELYPMEVRTFELQIAPSF